MKRFFITAFIAAFVSLSYGAVATDSLRFANLDINLGPRAAGMAGAFTAMCDDASAIFYNPAALSRLKMIELNAAYDKWLLDSAFQYGMIVFPVGYGSIGAMFTYTDFGLFQGRDEAGMLMLNSQIKPYAISGSLSYGAPINDIFSAGFGVRYSNLSIDDYAESLVLFDAGVLAKVAGIVSIGAALQNMDINFSNGFNVRGGAGVEVFNFSGNKMNAEADVKYSGQYGLSYAAGVEVNVLKILSIRAGYNLGGENKALSGISGLSAGVGINIDKLSIDYAFTSRGELGVSHLVGIKFLYESEDDRQKRNDRKMAEFLADQSYRDGDEEFKAGNYRRAMAYWEEVKQTFPDYDGIDAAINKVRRLIATGGSIKKAEELFDEGMTAYEEFDFDKAVKKWVEVKKMYPTYKDIDTWLGDAKELKNSKGMSKQAEKYFRDGIKFYNDCDYNRALDSWEKGLEKEPNNKKIGQYITRTKAKQVEIKEGLKRAKADVANDATVIEGIKRLRDISGVCPAYQDAADILSTLKGLIAVKTRDYYYKGIEKYTDGNLDAAIVYWNNIESLDPKSEYVAKVRRYITDARSKQKAIQGFDRKKK